MVLGLTTQVQAATGDVDGDGRITAVDAALAWRFVAQVQVPSSAQKAAADADGDGVLTRQDVEWLLQWSARGIAPGGAFPGLEVDQLATVAQTNRVLRSADGVLRLPSGVELRVAANRLTASEVVQLSKLADGPLDPVEHTDYYAVQSATLMEGGFTLSVPASDLAGGHSLEDIEAVALARYRPATGLYELESLDWQVAAAAMEIDVPTAVPAVSQRTERQTIEPASPPPARPLLVIIFKRWQAQAQAQNRRVILPVPFYQQGSYGYCWAAAATMAVNYALPAEDIVRPLTKPWDIADYLNIGPQDGLGLLDTFVVSAYRDYLKSRTGVEPERSVWPVLESFRQYVQQQINAGHPVVVSVPKLGHAIVLLGYELTGGKIYLHYHDPKTDDPYHTMDWEQLRAQTGPFSGFPSTTVVPLPPASRRAISLSILGHEDVNPPGMVLVSPMMRQANFAGAATTSRRANLRFSWYNPATTRYGFIGNDGLTASSPYLALIPNYYGMALTLAVANASTTSTAVEIAWELAPRGGPGPVLSGKQPLTLLADRVEMVPVTIEDIKSLSGPYSLWVEVHDHLNPLEVYDHLKLDMEFGPGMTLQRDTTPSGVRFSWSRPQGDFDGYKVWKRRSLDTQWTQVVYLNDTNQLQFTDTAAGLETASVFYAVTANRGRVDILMSSQVLEVPPSSRPKAGSLDLTFRPGNGLEDYGYANVVAFQAPDRVLIGGRFQGISGVGRTNLARLNADGSVDPTFNSGSMGHVAGDTAAGNGAILTLLVEEDRLVVGGDFSLINNTPRDRIARLLLDGTVDTGFDAGPLGTPGISGNATVRSLASQGQAILMGGDFISIAGYSKGCFNRLFADGTVDRKFNTNQWPGLAVNAIAQQADGRILVGGVFTGLSGDPIVRQPALVRFLPNGVWDDSFQTGGVYDWTSPSSKFGGVIYQIAVQIDGRILVSGSFKGIGSSLVTNLARLLPDGQVDPSFTPPTLVSSGSRGRVFALAVQPNGKILIGGNFDKINDVWHSGWSRLNEDGTVDTSFEVVLGSVYAIALQPDGKILVGGYFDYVNTGTEWITQRGIARLHGD